MVGCKKDYVAADLTSDAAWFTSETNKHPDAYRMNLGSAVSFMDASQGCKSHQWILEDGSSFMVDDFDIKDKDYKGQIDPAKSSVSTNRIESVYFGKTGETKVTLRNTFYEWVTAHDNDDPVEAILQGDEWVLTREFKVNVYDVLRPAFHIYDLDGNITKTVLPDDNFDINDKSTWVTLEVELGQKIKFKDLKDTKEPTRPEWDVPTGAVWSLPNSMQGSITCNYDESTGDVNEPTVEFSFNKMSPAGGFSGFYMTSKRTTPQSSTKKLIPLIVKIKAAAGDFTVDTNSIAVSQDGLTISFTSNCYFAAIDPSVKSDFALSVVGVNGKAIDGIKIAEVVPSGDMTKLNITLLDRVYPGEKLTLSYTGSAIKSADDRDLETFSVEDYTITGGSILDSKINSFEVIDGGYGTIGWATLGGTFIADGWIKQVDRPAGKTATNVKATRISYIEDAFVDGKGAENISFYLSQAEAQYIPAGKYKINLSYYLEGVPVVENAKNKLKIQVSKVPNKVALGDVEVPLLATGSTLLGDGDEAAPLNEWKTATFEYTHPDNTWDKKLQITILGTDKDGKLAMKGTIVYIDDLELIPVR